MPEPFPDVPSLLAEVARLERALDSEKARREQAEANLEQARGTLRSVAGAIEPDLLKVPETVDEASGMLPMLVSRAIEGTLVRAVSAEQRADRLASERDAANAALAAEQERARRLADVTRRVIGLMLDNHTREEFEAAFDDIDAALSTTSTTRAALPAGLRERLQGEGGK